MDNVQNCDSYINIPSSQTCRSHYLKTRSLYRFRILYSHAWYLSFLFRESAVFELRILWLKATFSNKERRLFFNQKLVLATQRNGRQRSDSGKCYHKLVSEAEQRVMHGLCCTQPVNLQTEIQPRQFYST
jgi:hypothetical protein